MDQSSFDQLAKRLGASISRRSGLAGIAGAIAGLAGISVADANVARPPVDCRSTNMQCISGDECCSGRCIAKADGTSRCARKTSNRKKKHGGKNGGSTPAPGPSCTVCASGCPYTTIEDAINDAPTGQGTVTITVGPGTYYPVRPSGDAPAALVIGQDMILQACDPTQIPPTISSANLGDLASLFFLGSVDENYDCTGEFISVVIDTFIITGGSDAFALFSQCNTQWTLSNSQVRDFVVEYPVIYNASTAASQIMNSTLRENTSSASRGAIVRHAAIQNGAATLTLSGVLVTANVASTSAIEGGILGAQAGVLRLAGVTNVFSNVISNTANGGGVYVESTLEFEGSGATVQNNTGALLGGGVYSASGGTVTGASNSSVYSNVATTCNNYYDAFTSTCVLG